MEKIPYNPKYLENKYFHQTYVFSEGLVTPEELWNKLSFEEQVKIFIFINYD